jgi:release factor glutamine methyltransferase
MALDNVPPPGSDMTYRRIFNDVKMRLDGYVSSPEADARSIVEHVFNATRSELMLNRQLVMTGAQAKKIDQLSHRRRDGYPLQYLLESVAFLDLNLLVQEPILIPRFDTEWWLENLMSRLCENNMPTDIKYILDIGTGSGCIALALAKKFSKAMVIGIDSDGRAVELARKNSQRNKIDNVKFVHASLDHYLKMDHPLFDLVVSNPPYLSHEEWLEVQATDVRWESAEALTSGDSGLEMYEEIIQNLPKLLSKNRSEGRPQIALEIGFRQCEDVSKMVKAAGFEVTAVRDGGNRDRALYCKKIG